MAFDPTWQAAVCLACDPVFATADAGFGPGRPSGGQGAPAVLWEADALRFAARYRDSGVEASYGDQWPAPCIDYWVYVDPGTMTARMSVEGWDARERTMDLTGDGARDGAALAALFGDLLRVDQPGD